MISKNELEAAIQIWKNYLENKTFIEEKMAKYDTNRSGKLELDQVFVSSDIASAATSARDSDGPSVVAEGRVCYSIALRNLERGDGWRS